MVSLRGAIVPECERGRGEEGVGCASGEIEGHEGRNGSRRNRMRAELGVRLRNVGRARFRAGKMGRAPRGYGAHRQLSARQNTDLGTDDVAPGDVSGSRMKFEALQNVLCETRRSAPELVFQRGH
jgi:hypothetical protein